MSNNTNWLAFFEDRERLHAEYYVAYAQKHARKDKAAYEALEAEIGNIFKIADWLIKHSENKTIQDLAKALWRKSDFLQTHGYMQRGLPLLQHAQKAARQLGDLRAEFTWVNATAWAQASNGSPNLVKPLYEKALILAEKINDPHLIAKAQIEMGKIQIELSNLNEAGNWLKQALQGYRQCHDYKGELNTLTVLGNLLSIQGDAKGAVKYLEQGLQLAKNQNDQQEELALRFALAYVGTATKNWPWAVQYYEPVVEMAHNLGDRFLEVRALSNLGEALVELGKVQQAITLLEEAIVLQVSSDDVVTQAFTHLYLAKAFNILNEPDTSLAHLAHIYPLAQIPVQLPEAAAGAWVKADNYRKKGDIYQAKNALEEVLDLAPDHMTDLRKNAQKLIHSMSENNFV